jgi:hypothetical protein
MKLKGYKIEEENAFKTGPSDSFTHSCVDYFGVTWTCVPSHCYDLVSTASVLRAQHGDLLNPRKFHHLSLRNWAAPSKYGSLLHHSIAAILRLPLASMRLGHPAYLRIRGAAHLSFRDLG